MIFRKSKTVVSKNIGKMDKLITGIIITGAAASILGYSRTTKGKKMSEKLFGGTLGFGKKSLQIFGKMTIKLISLFQKDKK